MFGSIWRSLRAFKKNARRRRGEEDGAVPWRFKVEKKEVEATVVVGGTYLAIQRLLFRLCDT
jgi:hypothetical protein